MKRVSVVLLLLAVAAIAAPGVARAKLFPIELTIVGAGLERPVTITTSAAEDWSESGDPFHGLIERSGFWEATAGMEPDPMLDRAPARDLGPQLVLTWTLEEHVTGGGGTLRQDIYPHADGGPLVYTEPGQEYFDANRARGGWFRAPSTLLDSLQAAGVPIHDLLPIATLSDTEPETSDECPVTLPSPAVLPDNARLFGQQSAHGNGELWVGGLGDYGVIIADPTFVDENGAFGWKFGWWRAVPGKLEIAGRRLDAAAPPARGDVPDGYGETGFQASGVTFPTEGCWEITGRVITTTLTFVTVVVKLPAALTRDSVPPSTDTVGG